MAKIVQLLNQSNDIYPRTLDQCVLVSGTTLLSDKISEIDGDINGFKDATIPVGKSISAVTDSEGNTITSTYVQVALLGAASGVATLGGDGKVPSSQLPSYVDDVVEYPSLQDFPETGTDGIIYIATDTNLTYRWSGTQYVEISPSLALGETSSTAYAGDKGKAVTDNFNAHSGNTTIHITAEERTAWDGAVESGHTHDNKSVLDGITSADTANWDAAYTDKHTHDNKDVLDGITSADTASWDAKPDTDTTYQFAQSGNTLMIGQDNGEKTAVYTPEIPSYSAITSEEINAGSETVGRLVTAAALAGSYNVSGNTINIGGDSVTIGSISEQQIRALFQ